METNIHTLIQQLDTLNSTGDVEQLYTQSIHLKKIAEKQNDFEGLCAAYMFEGFYYSYTNQLDKGTEYILKALNYAKEMNLEYYIMKCHNALGANYTEAADYFSALDNYLIALKVAQDKNDHHFSFIINNNIGSLFSWLGESKTGLHYLRLAYEDCLKSDQEQGLLFENIVTNLVEAYARVCGLSEIESLRKQYEPVFSKESNLAIKVLDEMAQAKHYAQAKQYEKAKESIATCISLNYEQENALVIYLCFLDLFQITIENNDFVTSKQLDTYIAAVYKEAAVPAFSYQYAKLRVQYYEKFFPYEYEQKVNVYKTYYKEAEIYSAQFKNTYVQNLKISLLLDESKLQMNDAQKENAFLQEEIAKDAFTNLLNKVYAQKYTQELMKKADASLLQVFMIVDIDMFKLVNDQYGHPFGDEVILESAQRLSSCVSEDSIIARFGGDEFFIYIPSTTNIELEAMVQQILAISKYIHFPQEKDKKQTYSIGVYAEYGCQDFDAAFTEADKALYIAKQQGRNQAYIVNDSKESKTIQGE